MARCFDIERCFTRTWVNTVVDSKLHERQVFAPLLGGCDCAQYNSHNTIGPFDLAIGLGMIGGRHMELSTKKIKHIAPKP